MKWCELSIHTTEEAIDPVAHILQEAGASGVVIEDPEVLTRDYSKTAFSAIYELDPQDYPAEGVIVKAYLLVNQALDGTVQEIKEALDNLSSYEINIGSGRLTLTEIKEEDWAHNWKQYYKPTQVTERVIIVPTWEQYSPTTEGQLLIELDPGLAFGTGTHPTTILAIEMLEKVLQTGARVIDVGCGSGILSIAAVKLGASKVLALDLDELAVSATLENSAINGLSSVITVRQNNLLEQITEEADIIVANILAEVIVQFVDDAYLRLKKGGYFLTSGIIAKKEEQVKEALLTHKFVIEETLIKGEWVAILAKKM